MVQTDNHPDSKHHDYLLAPYDTSVEVYVPIQDIFNQRRLFIIKPELI